MGVSFTKRGGIFVHVREKDHFQVLLSDLCRAIPKPPPMTGTGRRPAILKQAKWTCNWGQNGGFFSRFSQKEKTKDYWGEHLSLRSMSAAVRAVATILFSCGARGCVLWTPRARPRCGNRCTHQWMWMQRFRLSQGKELRHAKPNRCKDVQSLHRGWVGGRATIPHEEERAKRLHGTPRRNED